MPHLSLLEHGDVGWVWLCMSHGEHGDVGCVWLCMSHGEHGDVGCVWLCMSHGERGDVGCVWLCMSHGEFIRHVFTYLKTSFVQSFVVNLYCYHKFCRIYCDLL